MAGDSSGDVYGDAVIPVVADPVWPGWSRVWWPPGLAWDRALVHGDGAGVAGRTREGHAWWPRMAVAGHDRDEVDVLAIDMRRFVVPRSAVLSRGRWLQPGLRYRGRRRRAARRKGDGVA